MAWLTFTQPDGTPVLINTENVSAVQPCNDSKGRTLLEVRSGKDFYLQEDFDVVRQAIMAQERPGRA